MSFTNPLTETEERTKTMRMPTYTTYLKNRAIDIDADNVEVRNMSGKMALHFVKAKEIVTVFMLEDVCGYANRDNVVNDVQETP